MQSQSPRIKLTNCTFCLGDKPMDNLLWANKQKRASKCKPAKKNGILCGTVFTYYQPLN